MLASSEFWTVSLKVYGSIARASPSLAHLKSAACAAEIASIDAASASPNRTTRIPTSQPQREEGYALPPPPRSAGCVPGSAGNPHRRNKERRDCLLPLIPCDETLTQGADRRARGRLVPQPIAELLARRAGAPGNRRFERIGLEVVDREAQRQQRRHVLYWAGRALAAQPSGNVVAELRRRQPAQPHRAARPLGAGLRVERRQRPHLTFECLGRRGSRRRAPSGIGSLAWIVIGKIDDQARLLLGFEQPQRRQDHSSLECRVARRADRPAQFERHPQGARRTRVLRLRPDQRDRDAGDTLFLEIMPQRAHGARAERSNRGQQNRVDVIRLELAGDFLGAL